MASPLLGEAPWLFCTIMSDSDFVPGVTNNSDTTYRDALINDLSRNGVKTNTPKFVGDARGDAFVNLRIIDDSDVLFVLQQRTSTPPNLCNMMGAIGRTVQSGFLHALVVCPVNSLMLQSYFLYHPNVSFFTFDTDTNLNKAVCAALQKLYRPYTHMVRAQKQ